MITTALTAVRQGLNLVEIYDVGIEFTDIMSDLEKRGYKVDYIDYTIPTIIRIELKEEKQ